MVSWYIDLGILSWPMPTDRSVVAGKRRSTMITRYVYLGVLSWPVSTDRSVIAGYRRGWKRMIRVGSV
jgi:hypothetical protein